LVFVGALCIGTLINWAIYEFSYDSLHLSPWSTAREGLPPRTWRDRLPLIGWLRLRREAHLHGQWFWIRPILIELAYAAGMVWLFHFETHGGLLPPQFVMNAYPMFAVHAILIALLTIATFIDFDEQHIPDLITVPGAILLLIVTTIWPESHLPTFFNGPAGPLDPEPLLLTTESARLWPAAFDGLTGLLMGLAIVLFWWLAMVHATMTLRHGWKRALQYYWASFFRRNLWWQYGLVFAVVALGVIATWWLGGSRWQSLLTSLVGLAFAGGLVWGVRIGGYIGLRKEAMGFGDVTLMTMIGVALGWQASLLVFFLSPFTAVIVAVTQFIFTRRQDIAFGPYLALAAVVVIVGWNAIWENYARNMFAIGSLIPIVIVCFLLLMTGMLSIWRQIKEAIFGAT
jgi:leader peptidase (prepilin peptidase) / N-methyltransferase